MASLTAAAARVDVIDVSIAATVSKTKFVAAVDPAIMAIVPSEPETTFGEGNVVVGTDVYVNMSSATGLLVPSGVVT
jgi:hypothetical protein